MKETAITDLMGLTITDIQGGVGDESLTFTTKEGRLFRMYHDRDCCENVRLEELHGDFDDLIGNPVLQAGESSSDEPPEKEYVDSFTWTFYTIATVKGAVTLRWLGESNGYYSERVDFCELTA